MGKYILMGHLDLTPGIDAPVRRLSTFLFLTTALQHFSDQLYSTTSAPDRVYKPARHEILTIDAFDSLKVIGKGSFGKVIQNRKKDN